MTFDEAVNLLNKTLVKKQPEHFSSSWIFKHIPRAYHFFRLNVRTVTGEIDWDTVTTELDRSFQKRWTRNRRKRKELPKLYRSKPEVRAVFKKYKNQQYVFISAMSETRLIPAASTPRSHFTLVYLCFLATEPMGDTKLRHSFLCLICLICKK
jgi:hypothetical protein